MTTETERKRRLEMDVRSQVSKGKWGGCAICAELLSEWCIPSVDDPNGSKGKHLNEHFGQRGLASWTVPVRAEAGV